MLQVLLVENIWLVSSLTNFSFGKFSNHDSTLHTMSSIGILLGVTTKFKPFVVERRCGRFTTVFSFFCTNRITVEVNNLVEKRQIVR